MASASVKNEGIAHLINERNCEEPRTMVPEAGFHEILGMPCNRPFPFHLSIVLYLVFSYENINCSSIFRDWIAFKTQVKDADDVIDFLLDILVELRNYIEEYNLISTDHIRDTLTILYQNINSLAFDSTDS
ncbi:unnamed protein product [Adineta steineri]|uniref:Uncharacterized protein n=1 Tax=Adineta steineri TaxID=433720 RepID=A0A820ASW3_9BILA|nr:unnamed protein product [Adineta steineri]